MARIFVTGSTEGLGRAAAETLIKLGHQIVVHARNFQRSRSLSKLIGLGAEVVIGDLASEQETRALADQVNGLGRMDAIIHNAAGYADQQRFPTPEGHPRTLAVNVLAPYLLTALVERPDRLIYLTSGMHLAGDASLHDIDLDSAAMERSPGLLRQQAVRHNPRVRSCPSMASGPQQRRRPRLGANPNGRPGRTR